MDLLKELISKYKSVAAASKAIATCDLIPSRDGVFRTHAQRGELRLKRLSCTP